jgi:hypothetical protein
MPEPNSLFTTVDGGAVGCCGGAPNVDTGTLLVVSGLFILFLAIVICKCGFELLEGYGNGNVYDRRTGGLAGARSERDDTGYSAPNFEQDAPAYKALLEAPKPNDIVLPEIQSGKTGTNISANRNRQRERLAEFDSIVEITDIDAGREVGYNPVTSDDELVNYL